MKAYIDFETANRDCEAYSIGFVSDILNVEQEFKVEKEDWDQFNISFNFRTDEDFEKYLERSATLSNLEDFIEDNAAAITFVSEFLAWNATTERKAFEFAGYFIPFTCVMQQAKSIYGKQKRGFYKLSSFAKFIGIEVDKEKLHTALYDAQLTKLVHEKLMDMSGEEILNIHNERMEEKKKFDQIVSSEVEMKIDFKGEFVCATGKFPHHTKDQIYARIEQLGGEVTKNVTKKTTILIVADTGEFGVTAKIQKAMDAGIRIVSVDEVF